MITMDPETYVNFLRMTPDRFEELLSLVGPHIQKTSHSMREPISPQERLTVTLRYLASGDSMKSIAYQFRISPSTVSNIILETCEAIWMVLKSIAFWPLSRSTFEKVADAFWKKFNFPNCLGAIDGKHVVCQAFANTGSEFYNYKGTFSLVLMAVASADYRFLAVDIGCPGRMSDGGVLRRSAFGKLLFSNQLDIPPPKELPGTMEKVPYVFVADEAFPLTTSIMRPYPGKYLPDEELIFNYRMSRPRMPIENSYGILSAKWRIYRRPLLGQIATVRAIIKSTVTLHNWLLKKDYGVRPRHRHYLGPRTAHVCTATGEIVPGQWREEVRDGNALGDLSEIRLGSNHHAHSAVDVREKFTDFFMGPGQVDWQWRKIPHIR